MVKSICWRLSLIMGMPIMMRPRKLQVLLDLAFQEVSRRNGEVLEIIAIIRKRGYWC